MLKVRVHALFTGEQYAIVCAVCSGELGGWWHRLASEQSFITVEPQVVLGIRHETKICEGIQTIKSNKGNCSRVREHGSLNCSKEAGEETGS